MYKEQGKREKHELSQLRSLALLLRQRLRRRRRGVDGRSLSLGRLRGLVGVVAGRGTFAAVC